MAAANPDNVDPRNCRVCSDFKSWASQQMAQSQSKDGRNVNTQDTSKSTSADTAIKHENKKECPLFLDELGRGTWSFLHTMAAYYPENPTKKQKNDAEEFMRTFSNLFPCDDCATHLRHWMKKNPPRTENQNHFSEWLCFAHNEVNERLGKKPFDCSKVNERWRDGWKDGSCG